MLNVYMEVYDILEEKDFIMNWVIDYLYDVLWNNLFTFCYFLKIWMNLNKMLLVILIKVIFI